MIRLFLLMALWAPRTVSAAPGAPAEPSSPDVGISSAPIECGVDLPARLTQARLTGQVWTAVAAAERCGSEPERATAERVAALKVAGQLRLLVGDAPRAETDLKGALELSAEDPEALYRLAAATRDRPEEALRYARRAAAAQTTPLRRAAAERLGADIALDLGDAALARSLAESALKADGDDLDSLAVIVRALRGDRAAAAPYAKRAAKVAAKAPVWYRGAALRLSARIWLDLDERARALDSLKAAVALDPDDLDALEMMVKVARGGDFRKPVAVAGKPSSPADPRVSEKNAARRLEQDPLDLDSLRRLSDFARARGKLDDAKAFADRLNAAIVDAPAWRQVPAYHLMVSEWRALGNEDKARFCILRALELDWSSVASLKIFANGFSRGTDASRLAGGYLAVGGAWAELGDQAAAKRAFEDALARVPGYADAYRWLAELELSGRRLREALSYADQMIAASASDSSSLARGCRLKARIEMALGDEAAAREALARVLTPEEVLRQLDDLRRAAAAAGPVPAGVPSNAKPAEKETPTSRPEETDGLEAAVRAGRAADARALADKLVAASAQAPAEARAEALRRRAGALISLGDVNGAAADLEKVLQLAPGDAVTLSALLDIKKPKAEDALALVEKNTPADAARRPAWLVLRGLTRLMGGDQTAAKQDFDAALGLDAQSACHSGLFPAHRERIDPLIFELCAERFPTEAALFMDAGVARYQLGQLEAAATDFQKAAALKPDWLEAQLSLASTLAEANRVDEALAAADGAVKRRCEGPVCGQLQALRTSLRAARR